MGLCGYGAGPNEILITGTIGQTIPGGFMFRPVGYPGQFQIRRDQIVIVNPKTGRHTIRMKRIQAVEMGLAV